MVRGRGGRRDMVRGRGGRRDMVRGRRKEGYG